MSEDKKKSLFDDGDDLFASSPSTTENKKVGDSQSSATSLFDADSFFAATRPPRPQVNTEGDGSTSSIKSTLEEAMKLFSSVRVDTKTEKERAREIERHQEFIRRKIKDEKDNLAKDIKGVMLNKYSCVLKEITPTLSKDSALRKQLVEFSNKYMEQITRDNLDWAFALGNCEELEKVIETLKAHYDDVENVINAEYEKYFNSLCENKDEEWVLEAKRIENATKAERDLLILQYKTLFLEFIVYIEQKREILRNRPKF